MIVVEGRALVLRRRPDDRGFPHRWCLPGGQLEPDETPKQAVVRETAEETGLTLELRRTLGPRTIDAPRRPVTFVIHRFVGIAPPDEPVSLSDEHVDARWLDRAEAAVAGDLLPSGLAGEVTAEMLEAFGRHAL